MSGRLRELRTSKNISQRRLGMEVGISQQNVSKYELDINTVLVDMLKHFSAYYNVSVDYILGVSDVKHNQDGRVRITKVINENYEFLELYRNLNDEHKGTIQHMAGYFKEQEEKMQIKTNEKKKKG